MNINWQIRRLLHLVAVGLVVIAAGLALTACETPAEEEGGEEAAAVEPIKGTDVNRVTLTKEAAETLGIETATIRGSAGDRWFPTPPWSTTRTGRDLHVLEPEAADVRPARHHGGPHRRDEGCPEEGPAGRYRPS